MKVCKNCGFLINETDRFCTHCGVVQEVNEEEVKKAEEEQKPVIEVESSYDYSTRYTEPEVQAPTSKKPLILGIIGTAAAFFTLMMWFEAVYLIIPEMFKTPEFTEQFDEEMLALIWKVEIIMFTAIAVVGGIAGIVLGAIGARTKNPMKVGRIFSFIALGAGLLSTVLVIILAAMNL